MTSMHDVVQDEASQIIGGQTEFVILVSEVSGVSGKTGDALVATLVTLFVSVFDHP